MWKAHVPKIQPNQVTSLLHTLHLGKGMNERVLWCIFGEQLGLLHGGVTFCLRLGNSPLKRAGAFPCEGQTRSRGAGHAACESTYVYWCN